jgi:uncharacterized peroxidase-related enzyme
MPRITAVDPKQATGKAKELLDGVQAAIGATPNLLRTLAQSPAALEGYLGLSQTLSSGVLSAALREQIALTVAGANHCDYCASAHTLLGRNAGVSEDELTSNLEGRSADPHTQAVLNLAQAIVEKRGFISDQELGIARTAGVSDTEITEVVAAVAQNIFTNYFNHVAQTEIDFPHVSAGETEAAARAA